MTISQKYLTSLDLYKDSTPRMIPNSKSLENYHSHIKAIQTAYEEAIKADQFPSDDLLEKIKRTKIEKLSFPSLYSSLPALLDPPLTTIPSDSTLTEALLDKPYKRKSKLRSRFF